MTTTHQIPRLKGIDHSIAFLRGGYRFISDHCDTLGSDWFRTRIMMTPVICARGESAVRMFYEGARFTRQGSMPPTVLRLLQDKGSVQGLDGATHRHRKALFVDLLMKQEAEASFITIFKEEWLAALQGWTTRPEIVVFDEANLVLTRAICRWTGVPFDDVGDVQICHELSSMIENAGSIGPRVVAALVRRRKTEKRIKSLIQQVRDGEGDPATPLGRIAHFRDFNGEELTAETATVEVLNILRPTVAIGRYIMFAAMALHENPTWCRALHGADDAQVDYFVEEVRRLYPFFPVIGGIAQKTFEWEGYHISQGDWVLLDLHGTNHDPRRFNAPDDLDPLRGLSWRDQGFDFVPQGGGRARENHRCPGEQFTVAVLRAATRMMVENMAYDVPEQDFSMPLNEIPARPRSGMVLTNVRNVERARGN